MSDPLPIDADFRRTHRFPNLDGIGKLDLDDALKRFDATVRLRIDSGDSERARGAMELPGKAGLIEIHRALFELREGAGRLRKSGIAPVFSGQDCPEPQFIDRALDNFERWLSADSFAEIHPIEQAALSLTRLVDIWPFDFGNRTSAMVFASFFLVRAGLPPFAVGPDQEDSLSDALAAAIRMQTDPLVAAIYQSILTNLDRPSG